MEMRTLGRTGVKVSSLCLGCMMFGGKTSPDDSYAIIARALDGGINFLDTATVYSIDKSEQVTGEALEPIVQAKGVTMSQFSLAWAMAQPGVTSPIIGPRTMEQFEDNLKAAEVVISDEDPKAVDHIVRPGTHVSPYYEAEFGPHPYRV